MLWWFTRRAKPAESQVFLIDPLLFFALCGIMWERISWKETDMTVMNRRVRTAGLICALLLLATLLFAACDNDIIVL